MTTNFEIQTHYHGDVDTLMNLWELDNLSVKEKKERYSDWEEIKNNASAIGCLMTTDEITETPQDYRLTSKVQTLSEWIFEEFHAPLANHKLLTEWSPGFASAILIGENKIFTTGHSLCKYETSILKSKEQLKKMRVVFRFHKTDEKDKNLDEIIIDKNNVYAIGEIIAHSFNYLNTSVPDWALVKLDRKVVGIKPIQFDFSAPVGREVYVIACQAGTAVKFAGLGSSTIKKITPNFIESDTYALPGSSGGAFIDRITNKAIAILVRGTKDFTFDEEYRKKTGELRVMITDSEETSCAIGQRIFPEMFDFYKFLDKKNWDIEGKEFISEEAFSHFSLLFNKVTHQIKCIKDRFGKMAYPDVYALLSAESNCSSEFKTIKDFLSEKKQSLIKNISLLNPLHIKRLRIDSDISLPTDFSFATLLDIAWHFSWVRINCLDEKIKTYPVKSQDRFNIIGNSIGKICELGGNDWKLVSIIIEDEKTRNKGLFVACEYLMKKGQKEKVSEVAHIITDMEIRQEILNRLECNDS